MSIILVLIFKFYILLPFYLIAIILAILYNYKPFYFTGRPFLDFLTNAFAYGIVCYLIGSYPNSFNFSQIKFYNLSIYFLLMAAGSIASTTTDYYGDLKNNKITTSVFLGIQKSLILGIIFLLFALFLSYKISNLFLFAISIISIISFVIAIFNYKSKKILAFTYQVGGGLLILYSIKLVPQLVVIFIFLYIITYLFFKLKLGTTYPSLGE